MARAILNQSLSKCSKCANLTPSDISYRKCLYIFLCSKKFHSASSKASYKMDVQTEMKAWYIHRYGNNDELIFSDTVRVPRIRNPKDVLVKVHAASVNPLDIRMRGGYGRNIINAMRKMNNQDVKESEFPLILGRDFSGVVQEVGREVKNYRPGDEVWGAYFAHLQGTHAEFAVAPSNTISLKPSNLDHVEAASIPYVASTSWSALCSVGEITEKNAQQKRVLIHGGAGGIGSFAIQLMKTWGAEVTTVCSTDAVDLVRSMGADNVIDYNTEDVEMRLNELKGFDLILDTVGGGQADYSMEYLRTWRNSKFVSIVTPLMPSTDNLGLIPGVLKAGVHLGQKVMQGFTNGRSYRWAFYAPKGKALRKVAKLVEDGEIKPVIEKVYGLEQLPDAYSKVEAGHARGKTVINVMDSS